MLKIMKKLYCQFYCIFKLVAIVNTWPITINVLGCPPVLDWNKMDAEEGEITLSRQAENAPVLNTPDSIFKSVSICSPEIEFPKV